MKTLSRFYRCNVPARKYRKGDEYYRVQINIQKFNMKKGLSIFLLFMFMVVALIGCAESKYTVTWYDGDDVLKTDEVFKGAVLEEWTPEKTGYEFKGWYKDSSFKDIFDFENKINSNTSIYAKFEEKLEPKPPVKEEYNVNWYDGSTILKTEKVTEGQKVTSYTPTKQDYEFKGWYKDATYSELFDFNQPITKETNIYGKFEEIVEVPSMYDVIWYDKDEVLKQQKVNENEAIPKYTPQKEGYRFDGWYSDYALTQEADLSIKVVTNTSLYAKFTNLADIQAPSKLANDGLSFTYGHEGYEETYNINEKSFYVDGRLTDEEIKDFPYVFNTFNAAIEAAASGTEEAPMNIYIAPYVYWIHDPESKETTNAFGITKNCAYLHITGLTNNPKNVVIAANYGHDEGYFGGNWTMFNFSGDGLTLKNLTFGEYCNIDLVYPLDETLNYPKRTTNITQGQIGMYSGDKLYAENVHFISRLNMMPFNNSKRALYVNCHMESTDDSLNGSSQAVYLGCDLEFYSSKPWGGSSGVTLLDCDIKICHINTGEVIKQYLSKGAGRFNVIDCRFESDYDVPVHFGFSDILSNTFRSYYSNVTHNGVEVIFDDGGLNADKAVDITDTEFLKAYKVVNKNGEVIYNIYNLLRGKDEWDPLGQKDIITSLGASDIPTNISVKSSANKIETGVSNATITYSISGLQSTDYYTNSSVEFVLDEKYADIAKLEISSDGKSCIVTGTNNTEEAVLVIIRVITNYGHEGAAAITVTPSILDAPKFLSNPVISQTEDGKAKVLYELDLGQRADQSRIVWYTADNQDGDNKIAIAVGRSAEALKEITLYPQYVGKYLIVEIEPKHIRSNYGEKVTAISTSVIVEDGIKTSNNLVVDLSTFSTNAQTQVIPGYFTMDGHTPLDIASGYIPLDGKEVDETFKANWSNSNDQAWSYGTGAKNGVLGYTGIYQSQRGARIMYTPLNNTYQDMSLTIKVAPGKTAGQGFGAANQYMDVLIKFDTTTLTGYGLRIYRSTGDSCKFALVEYKDGKTKLISAAVESSAYLTECTITVSLVGNELKAKASTTKEQPQTAIDKGYIHNVELTATVASNSYGGICIHHTGTVVDNVTYIGYIEMNWQNKE